MARNAPSFSQARHFSLVPAVTQIIHGGNTDDLWFLGATPMIPGGNSDLWFLDATPMIQGGDSVSTRRTERTLLEAGSAFCDKEALLNAIYQGSASDRYLRLLSGNSESNFCYEPIIFCTI